MQRLIRLLAVLLVVLLGGAWAFAWATRSPGEGLAEAFANRIGQVFGTTGGLPGAGPAAGIQMPQGLSLGGPFSLTDQSGRAVTEKDYVGKWMLVYFGYTFCPDVCPTELGTMAAALDAMVEGGAAVVPVLITIDPQRDTPAQLADYVSRFHPRMQGLTGTPEQVAEVARRYRVYFAKAQRGENTDYLMDHSSFIYLVGPDARVRALFRPETKPEDIAAAVAAQVAGARGVAG